MRLLHAAGLGIVLGFGASTCGSPTSATCAADGVCDATCATDVDCEGARVKSLCEGAGARLVEPGDGTVLDCTTTWSWEQSPQSQLLTWANAFGRCDGLDLGGKSDWQLPTLEQLQSLLLGEPGTGGAWRGTGCRADAKYGGQCTWYWSATESSGTHAWGVAFQEANGGPVTMQKTNVNAVRCVRNVPLLSGPGGGSAGGGSAGGGSAGGGAAGCTKNSDCASPKICQSSQCVYECTADTQCSSLRRCSNHQCVTFSCGTCQRVSDHRCVDCGSGPYGCYC